MILFGCAFSVRSWPRRRRATLALVALAFVAIVLASGSAITQQDRPLKVVVPFPAGGAVDFLSRVLAEQIGRVNGPKMVIENRPGAASVLASEAASRALPDGATLLMAANSFIINPVLRQLKYDPLSSFAPICYLVRSPTVITVDADSPYRTLSDLLDAARTKPGEVTIGAAGPGTSFHIGIEVLKRAAHAELNYVRYPGDPPAIAALLGGHLTSAFGNYSTVSEHLKSGKLRALATGSRTRLEVLPDVPTVTESGYKDYELENWFSVVAPAKTPEKTIGDLIALYAAALQAPDVRAKLATQGLLPVGMCGKDFGAFIHQQYTAYRKAIRESKITVE